MPTRSAFRGIDLTLTALLFLFAPLSAQDTLEIVGPGTVPMGPVFETIDRANSSVDLSGWSYGVCADPNFLRLEEFQLGLHPSMLSSGYGPDFLSTDFDESSYGFGSVVSFSIMTLPMGNDLEMSRAIWAPIAPGSTQVEFCNTVGNPPYEVVFVDNGGVHFVPVTAKLPLSITAPTIPIFNVRCPDDPEFFYVAPSGLAGKTLEVDFTLGEEDLSSFGFAFPNAISGFEVSVEQQFDLLRPIAVEPAGPLAALGGGAGPSFFMVDLFEDSFDVVFSADAGELLEYPVEDSFLRTTYEGEGGGFSIPVAISLAWSVGSAVDSGAAATWRHDASIRLTPGDQRPFLRGDANSDGVITIADPIFIGGVLFSGESADCAIALDANGDQAVDIADFVTLVSYLFSGGAEPPPPFPECAPVPGLSESDCASPQCFYQ